MPVLLQAGERPLESATENSIVQSTFHTQVNVLFGGMVMALAAATALVWRTNASKPEALALLPMTGMTEGAKEVADGAEEIFTFENLRSAPGSRHRKKRKGRGYAAGQGGTCGYGNRGQKSRKGPGARLGFEGGQNPLWRRTPKLRGQPLGPGHVRKLFQMVSIARLETSAAGSTVQFDDRSGGKPVMFKVGGLRPGETAAIPNGLTVKAHAFTASAKSAIEAAGGKCVVIDKYSRDLDADGKVIPTEKVAMVAFSGKVMYFREEEEEDVDVETEAFDCNDLGEAGAGETVAMFAAVAVRSAKVGKYKEPAPLSKKMSSSKMAIVEQVHATLKASYLVFGFGVEGYTHAQLSALRRAMPAGTKIQVVKNTLFRMASRGTGFEALDPLTMGSKAWVFVPEDCFQDAVKAYGAFVKLEKRQDKNPIVGGSIEGQLLDQPQVASLTELPTKKELIAQFARLLKGLQTKVAMAVKATPSKLALAIRLATLPEDKEEK